MLAKSEYGMRKSCAIWWNWAIALAAIAISSAPVQAFYWYGWPGSGLPPDRTIVGPPGGKSGSGPKVPVGLPVVVTTPPPGQGTEPPGGGSGPHSTPEPATGIVALIGLGALAAARAYRRGKSKVAALNPQPPIPGPEGK
jgi:MYXO-CTERM domain-containing protein